MWDQTKRARFNELRSGNRQLNEDEKLELASLTKELEDAEAAYLTPATLRMRQENDDLEKSNLEVADLVQRKTVLIEQLERVLAEARRERREIEDRLATIAASTADD